MASCDEAAAAAVPPPPPPMPGKKGICLALPEDDASRENNLEKIVRLNAYWNYAWNVKRHPDQPPGVEFVPQVWGGAPSRQAMQRRLDEHVKPAIEDGTCRRLLAFNEPDKSEQSDMTVERCLEFWPQLEALGVPLCSPSCANPLSCTSSKEACQGVSGTWMSDFMTEIDARGYRCDYVGVHWYGHPDPQQFKSTMKRVYESYGRRPLIITEFAVADWKAVGKSPEDNRFTARQVLQFMKRVLPWIEQQPWIEGYAWFPFKKQQPHGTSSALFNAQGTQLTVCGKYYASITTENPTGDQEIDFD